MRRIKGVASMKDRFKIVNKRKKSTQNRTSGDSALDGVRREVRNLIKEGKN